MGDRQKSCSQKGCKQRRKRASQKNWVKANPEYFHGRYEETRRWRVKNPGYQKAWRAKRREIQDEIHPASPMRIIRFVVLAKLFKAEIQDKISV